MGCDYSLFVKRYFEDKYINLLETKRKIDQKANKFKNLLFEYNECTENRCQTKKIRRELEKQLEKIEKILEEIKEKNQNLALKSFNSSESFGEDVKPLEKPSLLNAGARSIKSPLKLDTAESILEDPEIMALISKNRNKFMRKFTGL